MYPCYDGWTGRCPERHTGHSSVHGVGLLVLCAGTLHARRLMPLLRTNKGRGIMCVHFLNNHSTLKPQPSHSSMNCFRLRYRHAAGRHVPELCSRGPRAYTATTTAVVAADVRLDEPLTVSVARRPLSHSSCQSFVHPRATSAGDASAKPPDLGRRRANIQLVCPKWT